MPAVRLMTTSVPEARMRSTTSRVELGVAGWGAGDRVADVDVHDRRAGLRRRNAVGGDRLGVNGTLSDLSTVSPLPVTAQVMKTDGMEDLSVDWVSQCCGRRSTRRRE